MLLLNGKSYVQAYQACVEVYVVFKLSFVLVWYLEVACNCCTDTALDSARPQITGEVYGSEICGLKNSNISGAVKRLLAAIV